MNKLLLSILWLSASTAYADIVQPLHNTSRSSSENFGQSFTATLAEPNVAAVGLMWGQATDPQLPDPTVTVELRSGVGFDGPLLGAITLGPFPDNTPVFSWIDFYFDIPIPLTAGSIYSLRVDNGDTPTSASWRFYDQNIYPDGVFLSSRGGPSSVRDLTFRVLSVPEPATLLIAAMSLFGLVSYGRNRQV